MTIAVGIFIYALLALVWLSLGVLAVIGARRRGQRWRTAWLTGPLFFLTWIFWYLDDEHAANDRAT